MCLAIEEMRNESKIAGAVIMCRDFGLSLDEIVQKIAGKFQLSEDEAERLVKKYWE